MRRSLHPKGLNSFFHHPGGYTEIFLTRGLSTLIDTSDFDSVHPYRWTAKPIRKGWYAQTGRGPNNKPAYLHCVLVGPLDCGLETDHRDGDGLNNRRSNFRIVTHSFNCFNVGGRPGRGVTFAPSRSTLPWIARITRDGKTFGKRFMTQADALAWRQQMEQELYGDFARESRRTWAEA